MILKEMISIKKYQDILRHGKSGTHLTLEGNTSCIVIQEKLDGANASFKRVGDEILYFSRNTQLDESNTLRGFTTWGNKHLQADKLLEGVIYFGEWLVKHKLSYGENETQFYLFDIYNENIEEYVTFSMVRDESERLGLNLVPVFYEGEFQSMEHIQSFVGKSVLGEVGEGVVIKNTSYKNRYDQQQFTKIVSDAFAEVAKVKKQTIKSDTNPLDEFINSTVTQARVSKIIHKLVDEDILQDDYAIEDMGIILKNTGTRVYDDVIKEELDELLKLIKSKIGRKLPQIVKGLLSEEGRA